MTHHLFQKFYSHIFYSEDSCLTYCFRRWQHRKKPLPPHNRNGILPRLPVSGRSSAPSHHTGPIPPAGRQDPPARSGAPYLHTGSSISLSPGYSLWRHICLYQPVIQVISPEDLISFWGADLRDFSL